MLSNTRNMLDVFGDRVITQKRNQVTHLIASSNAFINITHFFVGSLLLPKTHSHSILSPPHVFVALLLLSLSDQ